MRERILLNREIGLIKAMLTEGMKNDAIHFYFNRADRLLSSGRITQIKQEKYGRDVPAACKADLDTFLVEWSDRLRLEDSSEPVAPEDVKTILKLFQISELGWKLRAGETGQAECKKAFRLKPEVRFGDVVRTIAGLANNRGGYVLFGVEDSTGEVVGLTTDDFLLADPAEINRVLAGSLDPVPRISKTALRIGLADIGAIYVEKYEDGPVIALKNIGDSLKEATIYFRYVGETRAIKPGELRKLLREREQRAIVEFSRRMNQIANGSSASLDLETGKVEGKGGAFVIDENLLPRIKFLKEGDFSNVEGAPALRLIGDVEPASRIERERVKVIRDNVTPDAVIRNFLLDAVVQEPLQYIHLQAHCQRRWLPVWFYLNQLSMKVEAIIADLQAQVATHPASRDALVQRLLLAESARKHHVGTPAKICAELALGIPKEPSSVEEDLAFANGIMGLPINTPQSERLRGVLLRCLDRAQGRSASDSARRSAIYRASCRVDELLFCKGAYT